MMEHEDEDEGTPISDESADIDIKDLELGQQIGSGSYGVVYRGGYFNTDVAIKKIHPGEHQKELQKYLKREVAVLKNIQHPNIVQFIGVYYDNDSSLGGSNSFLKSNSTWIVTEYISGGNLHERIKNLSKPLSLSLIVKLSLDISLAMAYLHSRDIIFRDLKSKNILIDDTGSPIRAKVCDFGFARIVKNKQQNNRHLSLVGTDDFMAPEVILGMDYDESADIFSFGILLLEMITRKKISKHFTRGPQNAFEINEDEARSLIPEETAPLFIELIIDCIRYEASERPTFPNIIYTLKQLQALFPLPQSYENPLSPHSSPIIPRKNSSSVNSPFSKIMRLNSFDKLTSNSSQCNSTTGYTEHSVILKNKKDLNDDEKIHPINTIKIEDDEQPNISLNKSNSSSNSTLSAGSAKKMEEDENAENLMTEDQLDLDAEEIQTKVEYLKSKMFIVLTEIQKTVKTLGKDLLSITVEEQITKKYEDCRKVVEIKKTLGEVIEGDLLPLTPRKSSNPPTTRVGIFLKTMERSINEINSGLEIFSNKINRENQLLESINNAKIISKLKKIIFN